MIFSYAIISTVLVGLVSFVGLFLLSIKGKMLGRVLTFLLCFAVGALLGNAFFHLLPEIYNTISNSALASGLVVGGFLFFLLIDQIFHKKTQQTKNKHISTYGYLSLYSDAVHNFTDGVLIALAYMSSLQAGMAATLAILLHEIPQEIGDFGVLLKAGFTRRKALLFNFYVACTAVVGVLLTLWAGTAMQNISTYIIPLAAGGFLYIATVGLLPEIIRSCTRRNFGICLFFILLGLAAMLLPVHHH